jgi:hypothetical protein
MSFRLPPSPPADVESHRSDNARLNAPLSPLATPLSPIARSPRWPWTLVESDDIEPMSISEWEQLMDTDDEFALDGLPGSYNGNNTPQTPGSQLPIQPTPPFLPPSPPMTSNAHFLASLSVNLNDFISAWEGTELEDHAADAFEAATEEFFTTIEMEEITDDMRDIESSQTELNESNIDELDTECVFPSHLPNSSSRRSTAEFLEFVVTIPSSETTVTRSLSSEHWRRLARAI